MSDDRNIDDLLGLGYDDFDTYEPDDAVASDKGHDDDKLDQIMSMLRLQTMVIEGLSSRLSTIEAEHAAMRRDWVKGKTRETSRVPNMNALKITDSPVFTRSSTIKKDHQDDDSFTNVSVGNSEASGASRSIFESPHLNLAAASVFEGSVNQIKSRSQLSSLGYNHKGDV
jgi:hypothetical protein